MTYVKSSKPSAASQKANELNFAPDGVAARIDKKLDQWIAEGGINRRNLRYSAHWKSLRAKIIEIVHAEIVESKKVLG